MTAIVGPTNSGKSSIIRAIKAAINNQKGVGFITYNEPETTIEIVDNDNTIVWNKPLKKPATYVLNGREINKVGTTQHEEVAELLNMSEIDVGGKKIRLNFWEQMEKAFLMDNTPNQLFEFISQSKEQELMTVYQDQQNNHMQELSKDIKTKEIQKDMVTTELVELGTELNKYNGLKEFPIQKYHNMLTLGNNIKTIVKTIEDAQESILSQTNELIKYKQTVSQVEPILNQIKQKVELRKNINNVKTKFVGLLQEVQTHGETLLQDRDLIETLGVKTQQLQDIITKHSELTNKRNKVVSIKTLVESNTTQIKTLGDEISGHKNTIETINKELKTFKVCPFCNSPLNEGHNH